jgi:DnaK suppressor protein
VTAADVDVARVRLEDERAFLERELRQLTQVTRDPTATIGFGKRVGEGTSDAIGRIERVGQADALATKLADVERALEKLDEGSYGICDRCGATIPAERLEARPSSVLCVRCSAGT